MNFSRLVATVWIVFGVPSVAHFDSASSLFDSDESVELAASHKKHGSPDPNCWRPAWCGNKREWCPSIGSFLRQCGLRCRIPQCPAERQCEDDRKRCPDGTWVIRDPHNQCRFMKCPYVPQCDDDTKRCPDGTHVIRDPHNHCRFKQCPKVRECSPELGTFKCPCGTRVGRDPLNGCITWKKCPATWTCRNGWQKIPMSDVCNGHRNCHDGSDEHPNYGCQTFGIGRRLEEDGAAAEETETDDSTSAESDDDLQAAAETANAAEETETDDSTSAESDNDLQRRLSPQFGFPGRACCYAEISSCLSCSAGVSERQFCRRPHNVNVPGCEKFQRACCKARNSKCMSCSAGQTEFEFCRDPRNSQVRGCSRLSPQCCKAYHAFCLSACAGQTEEEYCSWNNRNIPGCEPYWGVSIGRRLSLESDLRE